MSAWKWGRGVGQRSRPGDGEADRRKAAKAADDGGGGAAAEASKAEGEDMFTRAGVAAE